MNRHFTWQMCRTLGSTVLLAAILSACVSPPARPPADERGPASPPAQPAVQEPARPSAPGAVLGSPGNPPFYDVLGQRYHVLEDSQGYLERGVASWYGREFHGKRTSNGEVYDMYGLTAAHKTLPLPTIARVTNLTNGKSIIVRVNDRGPFSKNRLIDMSYAAARELGMLGPGTTLVEVKALDAGGSGPLIGRAAPDVPQKAPAQPAAPGKMYVQVGAFGQSANAADLKRRLEQQGLANVVVRYDARSQPALYRVRVGPVADAREYDAVVRRVNDMQIRNPQLVVEQAGTDRNLPAADAQGMPGG